jgi:hypothetical protein
MNEGSNLSKIVKDLSDEERLLLLNKLNKLNSNSDEIVEESDKQETKKGEAVKDQISYASSIYDKGGVLYKILITLFSIFSGRSKEEVVINNELDDVKNKIRSINLDLIDFERRRINFGFIKEIIGLIKRIKDIEPVFDMFFIDTFYYYGFIGSLIENNFNDKCKQNLAGLSPDTLDSKSDYLDKAVFISEKEKRLKKFFSQIDVVFFEKIITQFNRLEILIKLIKFNYYDILKSFYLLDIDEPVNQNNYADFANFEPLLEKLYRILNSINFSYADIGFINEMTRYCITNPSIGKNGEQIFFTEEDITKITLVFEKVKEVKERIPFKMIFQYFETNLLYKPKMLRVSLDYLNIYKEYKKTFVDKLWEDHYHKVRFDNLNRLIKDLFKIYDYNTFSFFTLSLKEKVDKHSSFDLKNVRMLNVIAEFIRSIYKPKVEAIINRCLVEGIFKRDVTKSIVSTAYYTLNASVEKLKDFDLRFNEEQENGKKIYMTLKRVVTDVNFKAGLMNIIAEVNEESNKMVYELHDAIVTIHDFLKNLMSIENPVNIPITNLEKIRIIGFPNPFVAIEKANSYFNLLSRIYKLVEEIF